MNRTIEQQDILIEGGSIVCMDNEMRILEKHTIAVKDSKITALVPSAECSMEAKERIDASGCIVMPGLINTHSHLPMTYFRGLADDLPLDIWLNKYIWPLEAKFINHSFVYDATIHGAAEMLKNGITLSNDMYFQMAAIADACTDVGMKVIVAEAMIQSIPGFEVSSIGKSLMEHKARYSSNPLVSFSIAPHAIYTCGREVLLKTAELAHEHGLLVHMHLSESAFEKQNCLKEYGMKPVHYLESLGVLDNRCVFAHGVWVDQDEMEMLAAHDCSIAVCSDSNLKLCSGIAPLKEYMDRGVNLSLATDGVASNNNLDLFAEMDLTAKLHKVMCGDPSFMPAEQMLRMCTINAAKALGMQDKTGSLEAGKDADIILIDTRHLQSQPIYNPYSHLVYAISAHQVRDVIVAGKAVVRGQQLCRVDESEIIAKAQKHQNKLKAEL